MKGDTGDTGPQGPKGDKGDTGSQGPQGLKGDKGDQGIQGIQGDKGDKGDKGDTGVDGKSAYQVAVDNSFGGTVTQWLTSLIGPKGDKGDQGIQGIQGIQGVKGDKGDTGSQGIQGIQGIQGNPGINGTNGISFIGGGSGASVQANATTYMGTFVGSNSTTESSEQVAMPVAGTIKNFFVRLSSNVGGSGKNIVFTVDKNGVSQPVTCTITSGASSCSDVTHNVAFSAGDIISIKVVADNGIGNLTAQWSSQY